MAARPVSGSAAVWKLSSQLGFAWRKAMRRGGAYSEAKAKLVTIQELHGEALVRIGLLLLPTSGGPPGKVLQQARPDVYDAVKVLARLAGTDSPEMLMQTFVAEYPAESSTDAVVLPTIGEEQSEKEACETNEKDEAMIDTSRVACEISVGSDAKNVVLPIIDEEPSQKEAGETNEEDEAMIDTSLGAGEICFGDEAKKDEMSTLQLEQYHADKQRHESNKVNEDDRAEFAERRPWRPKSTGVAHCEKEEINEKGLKYEMVRRSSRALRDERDHRAKKRRG